MGRVRRALVLVVALGLSGCWLQPGYGPERQNWNPIERELTEANVAGLHERWSVPSDLEGEPLVTSTAVYLGGIRVVSASERFLTVRALSRRSGTLLWQRDLPVDPSIGHGSVLSVAGDEVLTVRGPMPQPWARFETLDAATGATVDTADVSNLLATATVTATGTVAGDVIASLEAAVTGGGNVQLVVRSRATFEVQWTAELGRGVVVTAPLVVAHGRIWVASEGDDGGVVMRSYPAGGCSAPTCEPLSSFPVPPPDALFDQIYALPLAVTEDDILLMRRTWLYRGITAGEDVVAVDNEGTEVRSTWFTELVGVAAGGDTVVAVGTDRDSTPDRALVAESWTSTWRSIGAFEGTPIVAGGLVYVAVGTSAVHAYDLDGCGAPTCDEIASVDLGPGTGGVYGMSVAGGMLFVHKAGPDGRLFAFGPS